MCLILFFLGGGGFRRKGLKKFLWVGGIWYGNLLFDIISKCNLNKNLDVIFSGVSRNL